MVLILFLVWVGAFVRSSGAGMGCPDWPKCFGQWIPPTSVSQLPSNYQEIYANRGYADVAFNPVKTWTEYLNRLTGMVIGIAVIVSFALALLAKQSLPKRTVFLSGLVVLLIGFEGWLGSAVVSSVLTPWVITAHMACAIIIVMILSRVLAQVAPDAPPKIRRFSWWFAMSAVVVQFILGSQIRQILDHQITLGLDHIGLLYWIHRSLSWLVVIGTSWVALQWSKQGRVDLAILLMTPVFGQMVTGGVFSWFGIVAMLRPIHLVLATMTIATLAFGYGGKAEARA